MSNIDITKLHDMELVTRTDLDGIAAGACFLDSHIIGEGKVRAVHPKDVQDGIVELNDNCITTNLPFDPRVRLAFDHHDSEHDRLGENEQVAKDKGQLIIDSNAHSAARVVYNWCREHGLAEHISPELIEAADKIDSAQLSLEDILNPQGWVLLGYIMDARSGFGRFRDFSISNYALMVKLISYCVDHSIDEILALPDVQERIELYKEHEALAKEQLKRIAKLQGDTAVLDYRNEDIIYTVNRFMIYAMFPDAKYSIHVLWGKDKKNIALQVGKSIINKAGTTHIGNLCLSYGGGGHAKAGSCQPDIESADTVLEEILQTLK